VFCAHPEYPEYLGLTQQQYDDIANELTALEQAEIDKMNAGLMCKNVL
jgi:hypothetical protein